jgi:hypothetical protein
MANDPYFSLSLMRRLDRQVEERKEQLQFAMTWLKRSQ